MEKEKKNPFIYLNEILNGKNKDLIREEVDNEYIPFLINRGLSYHKDCIFYANEINMMSDISHEMQYDFLFHSIRKFKRGYVKWARNVKNNNIKIVMKAFNCSRVKAEEYLKILKNDDLLNIISILDEGGT